MKGKNENNNKKNYSLPNLQVCKTFTMRDVETALQHSQPGEKNRTKRGKKYRTMFYGKKYKGGSCVLTNDEQTPLKSYYTHKRKRKQKSGGF